MILLALSDVFWWALLAILVALLVIVSVWGLK